MKSKILLILHLPPPVHGSAMVGQYIKDSKVIDNSFDTRFINLSTSLTIAEIGKNPIVKISRYFKIVFKLIKYLLSFKPETVYLAITAKGVGFYKDLPLALLVKLFGKKLVLHYHNKGVSNYQDKPLDNRLYKILFKNSKVILLSENLYQDISKYVFKQDVFFCPNGIPNSNDCLNKAPKKNEIFQFLFLSNLIESKGVYILLEALEILKNHGFKFHCNMVGGEGDISLEVLNNKIKGLNLSDSVTYLGKKFGNDKLEIFNNSDVFIHPTLDDCFPLVLLEAMQFSLPIISTPIGGIPDLVIHSETGFILEQIDSKSLASRMEFFINNHEIAEQFGKRGRFYFVNNYTLGVFENRLVHILKQL
ncbi:glycosyltransferase family 4 protein [Flavobacteriaceae bacterium]|nr:glycosyltransferase family 4 protein [Flavobacteriaceae bacterium]